MGDGHGGFAAEFEYEGKVGGEAVGVGLGTEGV